MLTDFSSHEFDEIDADNLYFQHDGAPLHVSRPNTDKLRAKFGESNGSQDHVI